MSSSETQFRISRTIESELEAIRAAGLWRRCVARDSPPGARVTIEGREYLHLCSNNYLDLAHHPEAIEAARRAAVEWGVGAGASPLVTGATREAREFEVELAEFKRAEAALIFSSGYMANLGALTSLAGRGDWLICDRLNHASLIDAARLSRAEIHAYPHNDAGAVAESLARAPASARKLIVTDGVFSMDGDLAPLADLQRLALEFDAWLVVDDAHGTGVVGPEGRGACASAGLTPERLIQIVTFSKALGSQGGAVVGPRAVVDLLVNRARALIFETALAPPSLAAARAALRVIIADAARRDRLKANVDFMRRGLSDIGFELPAGHATPIFPIVIGENDAAMRASEALKGKGYWVTAIRPPSVPAGTARLRATVMSSHEPADLQSFLDALASVAPHASNSPT